jgi:hypothetical protein
MPSRYLYLFWATIPLVVPILAGRLGAASGRWSYRFRNSMVPLMVLQLWLLPETTLAPVTAALISIGVCVAVAWSYTTLAPPVRGEVAGLAALLGLLVVAALFVIHVSVAAGIGSLAFAALLTLMHAAAAYPGTWLVNRIRRAPSGVDG